METAYCHQHEHGRRLRPIVSAGTESKKKWNDDVYEVSVTLDCGGRHNIVTTLGNLTRIRHQAVIASRQEGTQ